MPRSASETCPTQLPRPAFSMRFLENPRSGLTFSFRVPLASNTLRVGGACSSSHNQLLQNRTQVMCDTPTRVICLDLAEVRNVTDMISPARLRRVPPVHFLAGQILNT